MLKGSSLRDGVTSTVAIPGSDVGKFAGPIGETFRMASAMLKVSFCLSREGGVLRAVKSVRGQRAC